MSDELKKRFLCPYIPYRGQITLDTLTFDANLQEFAQRSGLIAALHSAGKLSSEEAFASISSLWWELADAYLPLAHSRPTDA
ncbi:DUF7219 family protein [Parathermosynechococcus lividus]